MCSDSEQTSFGLSVRYGSACRRMLFVTEATDDAEERWFKAKIKCDELGEQSESSDYFWSNIENIFDEYGFWLVRE